MMEGLNLGPLFDSLSKNVLETLLILQRKANKYIAEEELAKKRWPQEEGAWNQMIWIQGWSKEQEVKPKLHKKNQRQASSNSTSSTWPGIATPQCYHRPGTYGDQAQRIHEMAWEDKD